MSVTACFFFCTGDRGICPFQICGRYLIFLVKSKSLWKMLPLFHSVPFMPLVWGQRRGFGLRNFTLGFIKRSINLPRKRRHNKKSVKRSVCPHVGFPLLPYLSI